MPSQGPYKWETGRSESWRDNVTWGETGRCCAADFESGGRGHGPRNQAAF